MIPRQKLYYQVCTDIPQKLLKKYFWGKNRSKSSFPPTFSAKFSIFHEIRPDSSIGLSARHVCKISAKSDLICQKQLFGVQQKSKNWIFCTTINIVQSKRGRELKFSGSVEDYEGSNLLLVQSKFSTRIEFTPFSDSVMLPGGDLFGSGGQIFCTIHCGGLL